MELWVWDPLAPAASEPGGGGGGGGGGGAYHVFMAAPQTLGPQPPLADWQEAAALLTVSRSPTTGPSRQVRVAK